MWDGVPVVGHAFRWQARFVALDWNAAELPLPATWTQPEFAFAGPTGSRPPRLTRVVRLPARSRTYPCRCPALPAGVRLDASDSNPTTFPSLLTDGNLDPLSPWAPELERLANVVNPVTFGGGPGRTVHFRIAGVGSTFPARSIARARSVCSPGSSSTMYTPFLRGQMPKSAGSAVLSEHSKVDPGSLLTKAKLAWLDVVTAPSGGTPTSVVSGGVSSALNGSNT